MTKNEDQKQRNKEILYSALRLQKHSKKSILSVMQSMSEATDDSIVCDSPEKIKSFFEGLKSSVEDCNKNIETLEKLTKEIDDVFIWNNIENENLSKIDNIVNRKIDDDIKETEFIQKIEDSLPSQNDFKKEETKSDYSEKTLLISETKGKVVLPYEISVLEQELEKSNKYSSIDEIISKKYLRPISLYRNPFMSRFRESYKLMREKEKSSIKEAFDLGFELMFNYNLHPAIISACKNLDELDIYLDYLDSGETNKFKFFKVIFEIAPTIAKGKHSF